MDRDRALAALQTASALLLAALSSFFSVALAQDGAAAPQAAPADGTAMLGFLVVFIAMIVGYILWIRREQGKQKKDEAAGIDKS